jgi:hypothetical protein
MRLYGELRKKKWPADKDLSLYDRSTYPVSTPLQPLTSCNQTLGIVRLFGCAGASVHDAHGERCHIGVEPGQLGK